MNLTNYKRITNAKETSRGRRTGIFATTHDTEKNDVERIREVADYFGEFRAKGKNRITCKNHAFCVSKV